MKKNLKTLTSMIFFSFALDLNTPLYSQTFSLVEEFNSGSRFIPILGETPNIEPYCLEAISENINNGWAELANRLQLSFNQEKFFKSMLIKANDSSNEKRLRWSDYKKISIGLKGTECKFKGQYRLTGDGLDHFGELGELRHSIKIKLKNDNIGGIVKFKLLVPKTRGSDVEVLNTLLMKKLGFMAPRTALVKVQIEGETVEALFQEDITKELVEESGVHDGLLFEGDESLGIGSLFTIPRVTNEKLLSSFVNSRIGLSVFRKLNAAYLQTGVLSKAMYPELLSHLYDPPLAFDDMRSVFTTNIAKFYLLNFAIYAEHGLSQDDSRFVYDPIIRRLRPIYYDGWSTLRDGSSLQKVPFIFDELQRVNLVSELLKIDKRLFFDEAKNLGVSLNFDKVDDYLRTTVKNVKSIKTSRNYLKAQKAKKELSKEQIITAFHDSLKSRVPEKLSSQIDKITFYWRLNHDTKIECKLENSIPKCYSEQVNSHEEPSLDISFDESIKNGVYMSGFENFSSSYEELERHSFKEIPSVAIDISPNIIPRINVSNRTILFDSINNGKLDGQIIFHGGKLENWKIILSDGLKLGYSKIAEERKSKNGYTGCITFNDLELLNIELFVENTQCEDAVHFVRVKGSIKNITVKNSRSDAIDADFSNLRFKNVVVEDALNDCLDFSAGSYDIEKGSLTRCADKAVSLGEKGFVSLNNTQIFASRIGLVSKDSSDLRVNNIRVENTDICSMAYRKKREFAGALILGSRVECNGSTLYAQIGSVISISSN
jgi:hypothetical protein